MTRYVNKGHIARATLEATAWQTREVLDAMEADSGVKLKELKVDGGMVYNDLLMQFQADCLQVPVIRPKVAETTALGAAYAAGLAVGFWKNVRRPALQLGQGRGMDAEDGQRRRREGIRAVEEGGHQDVRLGGADGDAGTDGPPHSTVRRSTRRERGREPAWTDEKHEGDFAEGQEKDKEHDEHHEGSFAEGQQSEEHGIAAEGKHGYFAEGQEKDPDEDAPRGVLRRGSGQGARPRR